MTQRPYWLAWTATLTFFAGFYALLVPLPRYLASVGLPDWQIGLVLGAFGVASLVGRPITGVASDRFGPRQVMLVGAASLAIGALAVPLTSNLAALFALRVLQAVGYVAFTTAGTALVVTLVAAAERASRLAIFGAAANVAITLTPAVVVLLVEQAGVEVGLALSGALAIVGGLMATLLPTRSTAPFTGRGVDTTVGPAPSVISSAARDPGPVASSRQPQWLFPRRLWLPMLVSALLGAGFAAFFQFAPILAERRSVSPGLLYTGYGAAIIATRLAGGRLLDRFTVGRVVTLAAALMAVGHVGISFASTIELLLPASMLIAVSGGLFHPALIAHHAALLPEAPGRASAAFYVAFDLGIGLGSWLFGVALEVAGVAGLYWTAAALAAAVLPLMAGYHPPPDRREAASEAAAR